LKTFVPSSWLDERPPSVEEAVGVKQHFTGGTLRSNGTHEFKRTVLIVSIDGLR